MIRLLLVLLASLSLNAQAINTDYIKVNRYSSDSSQNNYKAEPDISGSVIGISVGATQTLQVDIGLSFVTSGYTAYGVHFSADSQGSKTEDRLDTQAGKSQGMSAGLFVNVGRAFYAVGGSTITANTQNIYTKGQLSQYSKEEKKAGAYVKAGYALGHLAIYAGYNTYYGTTIGVGYAF